MSGRRQSGSTRWYPWRGQNYYSVTTIIDAALRKYALEKWGPKMVALGVVTNRTALEAMLASCETPETCPKARDELDLCARCSTTMGFLKELPYQKKQRAADIGTEVHTAIEAYTLGKPMPPWALAIRPRMHQFERFLIEWRPTFELAEAAVYSRSQWYAGTLDVICTIPVELLTPLVIASLGLTIPEDRDYLRGLGDYKTSQRGIYSEIALQLAAYRHAEFIGLADGSEAPMPAVDFAFGLQLTDEAYHLIPVATDEAVFNTFIYAREMFRWTDSISKRVLFPELTPAKPPSLEVVA